MRGYGELDKREYKEFSANINYRQDLMGPTVASVAVLLLSYGSFGVTKKRKGAAVDFTVPADLRIVQADLRYRRELDGTVIEQAVCDDPEVVAMMGETEGADDLLAALPTAAQLAAADAPPNVVELRRINNLKPLPFAPHSFHRIIMRKGLCQCHNSEIGCGGVAGSFDTAYDFVVRVANALARQPGAAAYLHGVSKHTDAALWRRVARRVFEHFHGDLNVGLAVNSSARLTGLKLSWTHAPPAPPLPPSGASDEPMATPKAKSKSKSKAKSKDKAKTKAKDKAKDKTKDKTKDRKRKSKSKSKAKAPGSDLRPYDE